MRKFSLAILAAVSAFVSAPAFADPAAMFGVSYRFGERAKGWGLTAKVLSDNEEAKLLAAAGVSWYPQAQQKWGADIGFGYLRSDAALTIGYDLFTQQAAIGFGWADLNTQNAPPQAVPVLDQLSLEPEDVSVDKVVL